MSRARPSKACRQPRWTTWIGYAARYRACRRDEGREGSSGDSAVRRRADNKAGVQKLEASRLSDRAGVKADNEVCKVAIGKTVKVGT